MVWCLIGLQVLSVPVTQPVHAHAANPVANGQRRSGATGATDSIAANIAAATNNPDALSDRLKTTKDEPTF